MFAPADAERPTLICTLAWLLAMVSLCVSLFGLLDPAAYQLETANWAAQAKGQDWFDLILLAPLLVVCGIGAWRRSSTSLTLLGSAFAFALYTFLLYAFSVHFNRAFLLYCGGVGLSFFGLVLVMERRRCSAATPGRHRWLGAVLMLLAVFFAVAWLSDIAGALVHRRLPSGLADIGLPTNPVHVLDLSIFLPATFIAGWSAWRGRRLGSVLAPVMLGFAVIMGLSIATLFWAMARYN